MSDALLEHGAYIYSEMMSHPALFSHPDPETVVIIGACNDTMLAEILKHKSVKTVWQNSLEHAKDTRVRHIQREDWLSSTNKEECDVCIILEPQTPEILHKTFSLLRSNGILVQNMNSIFQIELLKSTHQALITAGFHDTYLLNFPQPQLSTHWHSAYIAKKQAVFRKIREKDIFNKNFPTYYYNFDTHKAALAVPEFLRIALSE